MSHKQKQTIKKVVGHRLTALYSIAGVLLVLAAVVILYVFNYFGAPTHPDFKAYRATVTLNGNVAADSTLTRIKSQATNSWRFDHRTVYSPDDVVMYQRDAVDWKGMYGNCKNVTYTPDDESTCTSRSIKNGGQYLVVVSKHKGKIFGMTVEGRIAKTALYVMIPATKVDTYAVYDWQSFFDSLKPVDIQNMAYTDQTEPIAPF